MQTLSRQVTVTNPQGLHARPADLLVRCAKRFDADIEVAKNGNRVNGKSILDLLMLAAEQDSILELYARGDDAEAALEALAHLFEREFEVEEEGAGNASSHTAGENLP